MNPNNQSQSGGLQGAGGHYPQGGAPAPHPSQAPQQPPASQQNTAAQQTATVAILKNQIDSLYGDNPVASGAPVQTSRQEQTPPVAGFSQISQQQTAPVDRGPYDKSMADEQTPRQASINPKQWGEYHSAWQNYYQKYYEAYYTHQDAERAKQQQSLQQQIAATSQQQAAIGGSVTPPVEENISQNQAMEELRRRLLNKVKKRAEKVRKSRHFMPIAIAAGVMLLFVFIQYNRVFIATVNAYVSPGSIDPQNIIINPDQEGIVGEDPRLIIPKINVDVPVVYGIGPDHDSQMKAMEKGIAHFAIPGANSRPGQIGNTVLSGHSSNDLFDGGDYKFIFAQLEKLVEGDTIYANYEGKRYTYAITKREVVKPTEVGKLVYPTDKPILTLITCTPLGTSLNRLLVTAEQISPSPADAAPAPTTDDSATSDAAMPGNSATLLERLFGAR